jgi:hypothetical protein
MWRASDGVSSALAMCGMDIRRELKRYYGTPEKAEAAIGEAVEDIESLESWATIVTAKEERAILAGEVVAADSGGEPFRFSDIPAPMRDVAIQSIAAAMLAWTAQQERGAA